MIRKRVIYIGRVQGVGFRYNTAQTAANYNVTGYVCNLADGTVEVVVEGSAATAEAFLDRLGREMAGYIRKTKVQDENYLNEFDSFSIRH